MFFILNCIFGLLSVLDLQRYSFFMDHYFLFLNSSRFWSFQTLKEACPRCNAERHKGLREEEQRTQSGCRGHGPLRNDKSFCPQRRQRSQEFCCTPLVILGSKYGGSRHCALYTLHFTLIRGSIAFRAKPGKFFRATESLCVLCLLKIREDHLCVMGCYKYCRSRFGNFVMLF